MGFEMYVPLRGRANLGIVHDPVVNVAKSGAVTFSAGAANLLNIVPDESVILLFDRALGQVGIRASKKGDPAGSRLKVISSNDKIPNAALRVNAPGFFKQFGIDLNQAAGVHNLSLDGPSGLVILQLPKGSWVRQIDNRAIRERLQAKRDAS